MTSARVPAEQRRERLDVMRTRDDEWSRAFQRGIESGAPDYVAWFGQREQYRAAWRAFFREWDVLLAPAFITPAYPHWDKPWPNTPESIRKTLDVNDAPVLEEIGLFCASVATLGRPAGDGVPGRPHARRLADRPAGDRAVPRGPHADPVRGPRRARARRLRPPAPIREGLTRSAHARDP